MKSTQLSSITPITPRHITFIINAERLVEAINYCNLGLRDLSTPINANGFIIDSGTEIPEYFDNEEIILELYLNHGDSPSPIAESSIISSTLKNITKALNYNAYRTRELIERVFDLDNPNLNQYVQHISLLPDGSVCIAPNSKTSCKIKTKDRKCLKNSTDPFCGTVYFSYSLTFSFSLIGTDDFYYFIIDPLLKISSGNRQ